MSYYYNHFNFSSKDYEKKNRRVRKDKRFQTEYVIYVEKSEENKSNSNIIQENSETRPNRYKMDYRKDDFYKNEKKNFRNEKIIYIKKDDNLNKENKEENFNQSIETASNNKLSKRNENNDMEKSKTEELIKVDENKITFGFEKLFINMDNNKNFIDYENDNNQYDEQNVTSNTIENIVNKVFEENDSSNLENNYNYENIDKVAKNKDASSDLDLNFLKELDELDEFKERTNEERPIWESFHPENIKEFGLNSIDWCLNFPQNKENFYNFSSKPQTIPLKTSSRDQKSLWTNFPKFSSNKTTKTPFSLFQPLSVPQVSNLNQNLNQNPAPIQTINQAPIPITNINQVPFCISNSKMNQINYMKENNSKQPLSIENFLANVFPQNLAYNQFPIFTLFIRRLPNYDFNELVWFYKDPQNEIQGPFTSSDMDSWNAEKYFSGNLLISWAQKFEFISLQNFRKNPIDLVFIAKKYVNIQRFFQKSEIISSLNGFFIENRNLIDIDDLLNKKTINTSNDEIKILDNQYKFNNNNNNSFNPIKISSENLKSILGINANSKPKTLISNPKPERKKLVYNYNNQFPSLSEINNFNNKH